MNEGKLVRDKIPEIIIVDGKKPITRILNNDEYLQELDKKLNEEIAEYQEYTQTDEFVEDVAREKLGLVYDDEIVFIKEED